MTDREFDDARVVQEVLEGDREAYAVLVRRHQGKVLSLCLSLLKRRDAAEDAAQDVFLKAYKALSSFRRDAAFSTWLYRISYRHCLDVLKAAKRRREEALEDLPRVPAAPPDADPLSVESLLSGLTPEYRLVLTLREVQGLSYDEMAAAMDASLDSVKARLRRARRALQESARHFAAGPAVQTGGG
jgi:RNA polymerase sigma-70 factor, ECF subfamily